MVKKVFLAIEALDDPEAKDSAKIDLKEYMATYKKVYEMCTQRSPANFSQEAYKKVDETLKEYNRESVFKAVKARSGVLMLKEFARRRGAHEMIDSWMLRFLQYINRYYVSHHNLPTLKNVGAYLHSRSRLLCRVCSSNPIVAL